MVRRDDEAVRLAALAGRTRRASRRLMTASKAGLRFGGSSDMSALLVQ